MLSDSEKPRDRRKKISIPEAGLLVITKRIILTLKMTISVSKLTEGIKETSEEAIPHARSNSY